ncbi:hypothetical protein [Rhizobium mongolense]|uniref:hypothetical protein n=1 Tax=Rhizobium mongolense TaxID=57676 RepID=UPI0034A20EB1
MPAHRVSSAGANHEALPKSLPVATLKTRRPNVSLAGEHGPGLPKARTAIAKACFAWGRPQSLGHADANRMMVELQTAPVEPPRGAFPTRSAGPKLPGGLPSEFGGV